MAKWTYVKQQRQLFCGKAEMVTIFDSVSILIFFLSLYCGIRKATVF